MQAENPKASGDCFHLPLFADKVKQARDVVMTSGLPYSYPHMTGESYRVTAWPRKRQIVWSARLPLSIWDLLSDFFSSCVAFHRFSFPNTPTRREFRQTALPCWNRREGALRGFGPDLFGQGAQRVASARAV